MFYANPKPVARLKINQFLKVEPPSDAYLAKLSQQSKLFQSVIEGGDLTIRVASTAADDEIPLVASLLKEAKEKEKDSMKRGVAALLAFHKRNEPEQVDELFDETPVENITIFSPLRELPPGTPPILAADADAFAEPLLPIQVARDYLMSIGRLSGAKDKLAGAVANEIIKDLQMATNYPPIHHILMDVAELTGAVHILVQRIHEARDKASEKK
jgi:intracellular multiplication protein IcmO